MTTPLQFSTRFSPSAVEIKVKLPRAVRSEEVELSISKGNFNVMVHDKTHDYVCQVPVKSAPQMIDVTACRGELHIRIPQY